jgi:soluble lytic murein transglycosylase
MVAGIVVTLLAGTCFAADQDYTEPRELFKIAYPEAVRGNFAIVDALGPVERSSLEAYPLWPDLKGAWLKANLRTADEVLINTFLEQHGSTYAARNLRYRYAMHLAGSGQHQQFLAVYNSVYKGLDIPELDCRALAASLGAGDTDGVAERGIKLWMTGKSQDSACDPVFAWMKETGELTKEHYAKRHKLAIEERQFNRARWLGKSVGQTWVEEAEAWQSAKANPAAFLDRSKDRVTSPDGLKRLRYAFERLTYRDPIAAEIRWQDHGERHPFSAADRHYIERHIALWTARDRLPNAYELLRNLPAEAQDDEVLRWRARVSLREGQWARLLDDIEAMPASEAAQEEWRYWRAAGQELTGAPEAAAAEFDELARERSYYGFLAADARGLPYALMDEPVAVDESLIAELETRPELIRARELFLVGLDSRGRPEWDAAVKKLSREEKLHAAVLANRWGWHSRAIATAARASEYDDLGLRYPLPFADVFQNHAQAAEIPATWALGVARSESLFMRDVRSHAGAVGLMQLMPDTGRAVARRLNVEFGGIKSLKDPATNIRLGTSYLGEMQARFGGNRVLATAAYNAGPHRVDAWMPQSTPVETRVWVENIPFNETRKYVRRVLAAETIFHWRMTGDVRRLSDLLATMLPPPTEQVASGGADPTLPHSGP